MCATMQTTSNGNFLGIIQKIKWPSQLSKPFNMQVDEPIFIDFWVNNKTRYGVLNLKQLVDVFFLLLFPRPSKRVAW